MIEPPKAGIVWPARQYFAAAFLEQHTHFQHLEEEKQQAPIMTKSAPPKRYTSFQELYPYYLPEHQHTTSRVRHFIGTCLLILVALTALILDKFLWLLLVPVIGYGFAWAILFERNKHAAFQYRFTASPLTLKSLRLLRDKQSFEASRREGTR